MYGLVALLGIVLVFVLAAAIPGWQFSVHWAYGPPAALALIFVLLVLYAFVGRDADGR